MDDIYLCFFLKDELGGYVEVLNRFLEIVMEQGQYTEAQGGDAVGQW